MDKPFRRDDFGQYRVALCILVFLVSGLYTFFSKRPLCDLSFPVFVGCSMFILLRLYWLLQEVLLYKNSFSTTLYLVVKPSNSRTNQYGFWCLFVVSSLLTVINLPPQEIWFENKIDILILLFNVMIGVHFQWFDCGLLESYRLEKPFSYSGGSAMAFSFYYGYLNLIARGLVSRMESFRDNEGIKDEQMPQKKLFILVPSSSFVFDKLEGYQQRTKTKDLKIEHVAEKFEYHKQDRGLVKGRTYKNTMYIVEYSETEKYYILLEGATPLKTFYETCKEHKEFEINKREVISSFYYTLKKLIQENREMKDIVKLIYYDDESRDITILDIVRERILKKRGKEKEHNGKKVHQR